MKNSRIFILACGIICSLIMGFAYTYSIVQPYIMDYFSIASYMASLPYTTFLALFVVGNYVGGVMQKKHSVKMIMLIGYLLMAARPVFHIPSAEQCTAGMWFTYGTLLGIGDGMVYNVIIAMMQKWFPDKKGLATGITLAVLGISATILSPLSSTWLTNYGFTGTFRILAVIFAVVAVFGMLTIKAPPAGYMADYKPSAWSPFPKTPARLHAIASGAENIISSALSISARSRRLCFSVRSSSATVHPEVWTRHCS